ncbi:MAG: PIN domain-containing protein [Candidatus Micrarchaeota archaeon]
MKAVVDANVLFAALLRKGLTRKLLFNPELELFSPQFVVDEFLKHRNYLVGKYGGTEEKFGRLVERTLNFIDRIPDSKLDPYAPAAKTLSPDPKDWQYLAAALYVDAAIWSNDAGMKKQQRVRVFTTEEIAREIGTL